MHKHQIFSGEIINDTAEYTLEELCEMCGVNAELIIDMVNYGILHPTGKSLSVWHFSPLELQRSQRALRLQHDLDLNLAGVALALELIEELEDKRYRVMQMQRLLKLLSSS